MASHVAGDGLEAYTIPVTLKKVQDLDNMGNPMYGPDGKPVLRCGFRIGGGVDQDPSQSPHGYPDKGIYVTYVHEGGPAALAGLQQHDKLLQVNGYDLTMATHKKACEQVSRKPVLQMLVYRAGMSAPAKPAVSQYQNQAYHGQAMNMDQGYMPSQPPFGMNQY